MKKKLLIASVALGMMLTAGAAYAAPGAPNGAGIRGTAHDLSATGVSTYGTDGQNRICVWCHAPHNTIKRGSLQAEGVDYLPLWNHAVSTNTSFQVYNSGTEGPDEMVAEQERDSNGNVLATGADIPGNHASQTGEDGNTVTGDPGSVSRLCLSCHDGSVAVNAYGFSGSTISTGAGDTDILASGAQFLVGLMGDLSNHHPIGFDYDYVALNDDEIADKGDEFGATGVAIEDLLYGGNMECVTCHDVHNSKNAAGAEKFLWISNDNSNFCLTCHLKGTLQ